MLLDSLALELFAVSTYRFERSKHKPVEWGKWQLDAKRGLIGVQVENMDGFAALNAMLDRWQIMKLTPQQLVLKPFGMGNEYLVFAPGEMRNQVAAKNSLPDTCAKLSHTRRVSYPNFPQKV